MPAMIDPVQSQPIDREAAELSRLLELELVQNRAAWEQTRERTKLLRCFAFLFVFLLLLGCLVGFFFVFTRVSEERQNRPAAISNR